MKQPALTHLRRQLLFAMKPKKVLLLLLLLFLPFSPGLVREAIGSDAKVALLLHEPSGRAPSHESMYAREIAQRIFTVQPFHVAPGGVMLDSQGKPASPDSFDIIWCHFGVTTLENTLFAEKAFADLLRKHLDAGKGLLLTGGAVLLLPNLELDTIATRPLTFGNDRDQSGLRAVQAAHPVFTDMPWERDVLWLSNAAYPNWSHVQTSKGVLLGINTERSDVPLLEYSWAANPETKILAAPWRIGAVYDYAPQGHRRNFEQFLSNMVRYLGGSLNAPAKVRPKIFEEIDALELAVTHLHEHYGNDYKGAAEFLAQLKAVRLECEKGISHEKSGDRLRKLKREILFAHPRLDFEEILFIRRGQSQLGLPLNYHGNSTLPKYGYDNEIAVLRDWKEQPKVQTLYRSTGGRFLGDIDLHFDADRMIFSMIDLDEPEKPLAPWRVYEMKTDGSGLKKIPLIPDTDVDCFDPCYLPDDGIVFCSTACFAGVPCVNGAAPTCNLYRLDPHGTIRQLTYEQDQNWCPTLLNNGRLLYLRWEYTDIPHAFARILFHANPDGTNQTEYYGSGSYWPGSMFFAKPIPDHPSKFVAITGGHHELPRMGDLVLFDPARGRREAEGAIQRIPGRGRTVEPVMLDLPIERNWPKFLHPIPLDENFFLVSAKPSPEKPWGIYLVDTFDNIVLIHEEAGYAFFEPQPIARREHPPIIPDRIDPTRDDAEIFIADIYAGEGLAGVPRGSVKSLRIFSYQFSYQNMGAEPYSIGMDGPWDPRRILGTVPVFDDGSAYFKVPAYMPISIQPLDAEGKAIQLMRSWITAMPGETVSCAGCHEKQNTVVSSIKTKASNSLPLEVTPWYGPIRGFSFSREVQPVLDRYCTPCHHQGNEHEPPLASFEETPPKPLIDGGSYINQKSRFSQSYYHLRRYVRASTKEGTMQVPRPWEYHADTTRLVQLLNQGHHGVELDAEAWDRLITWIDLNAPFHGNWRDIIMDDNSALVRHQFHRRHDMRRRYAYTDSLLDDDPDMNFSRAVLQNSEPLVLTLQPAPEPVDAKPNTVCTETFDPQAVLRVELAPGVELELVPIPPGEFLTHEQPPRTVRFEKPFYMGRTEITNRQYHVFDPQHDSRIEFGDFMHFSPGEQGWSLSLPEQPVVRVTWNDAVSFCDWLSEKTGRTFALPSEEQWEYAARSGADTPFWFGTLDTDFSPFANLSDVSNQRIDLFGWDGRADTLPAWRPAQSQIDDGARVSVTVGSYRPNFWGLYDMHGNVAEWTCSVLSPQQPHRKIVKGGSWYDPPHRAMTSFRQDYLAGQPVYDVGFRVVVVDENSR